MTPGPGSRIAPSSQIVLRVSKTVDDALGSARPTISPKVPGRWRERDDHTLAFTTWECLRWLPTSPCSTA